MRILRNTLVILLAIAFAASLAGCDLIVKKAVENATGVKVNEQNGQVTIETSQGTATTSEKLPADFPSDVPVYQPSTVQSSIMTSVEAGKSYMVGLFSTDPVQTVSDWYAGQLKTGGWTTKSEVKSGDGGAMYNATNGTLDLTIVVGPGSGEEAGKTQISMVVAPAKK